jgi:hypothetical protein
MNIKVKHMNKKAICKCKQYKKQIEDLKTIIQDLKAQYNVSNTQHVNSIKDLIKDEPTHEPLQNSVKPNILHLIDHDLILKDNKKWVESGSFPEHNICNTKFDPESFNKQFEQHNKVDMTDVLFVKDTLNPRNKLEPYKPNFYAERINGISKFDLESFNKHFESRSKVDMTDVLFVTDPLNTRNNNEPYNPNLLPIKEVSGREKFDLDEFNRQFEKLN